MRTLLVLGSKPDPALPPPGSVDAVACANASGFSAARLGLPDPVFTTLSAIVTSGIASGRQSLRAMRGLRTGTLYVIPRPAPRGRSVAKRAVRRLGAVRTHPLYVRLRMRAAGFHFDRFEARSLAAWHDLVRSLCGGDPEIAERMLHKQPSTGLFAIAIGLAEGGFDRVVVAGMSFELTHAYGPNPEIAERGTAASRHADTDVAILACLARHRPDLCTSEPIVAERTGVSLLAASPAASRAS
jgi:hypothetical protein